MAKVIDLKGRKKIKEDLNRSEKLAALQSVLRCACCAMRCAKCGAHGESSHRVTHPSSGVNFTLCATCFDEYQDLLTYLDPEKRSDLDLPVWCNREWVRQWLAWLDYQWALLNYTSSPEVIAVISELKGD